MLESFIHNYTASPFNQSKFGNTQEIIAIQNELLNLQHQSIQSQEQEEEREDKLSNQSILRNFEANHSLSKLPCIFRMISEMQCVRDLYYTNRSQQSDHQVCTQICTEENDLKKEEENNLMIPVNLIIEPEEEDLDISDKHFEKLNRVNKERSHQPKKNINAYFQNGLKNEDKTQNETLSQNNSNFIHNLQKTKHLKKKSADLLTTAAPATKNGNIKSLQNHNTTNGLKVVEQKKNDNLNQPINQQISKLPLNKIISTIRQAKPSSQKDDMKLEDEKNYFLQKALNTQQQFTSIQGSQIIKQQDGFQQEVMTAKEKKRLFIGMRVGGEKLKNIFCQTRDGNETNILTLLLNTWRFVSNLKKQTQFYRKRQLSQKSINLIGDLSFAALNIDGKSHKKRSNFISQSFLSQNNQDVVMKNDCCFKSYKKENPILKWSLKVFNTIQIINPQSYYLYVWDIVHLIFILFYLIVKPIELVTMKHMELEYDNQVWQVAPKLCIATFFIDIFLNFNTGFYQCGIYIVDREQVIRNYIKNGFIWDFFALWPLIDSVAKLGHLIRLVNIFTLCKYMTLRKILSKHLELFQLQNQIAVSTFIRLLKIGTQVLFSAHIFACLFLGLGILEKSYGLADTNWLEHYSQVQQSNLSNAKQLINDTVFSQYVYSFYWSVTTMTTTGYGDISASNTYEATFSAFSMIIAGGVFAFSFNQIGIIVSDINKENSEFQQDLKLISKYLQNKNIKRSIQIEVTKYIEYKHRAENELSIKEEKEVLEKLGSNIKSKIIVSANLQLIKQIPFLINNFSKKFLRRLALSFQKNTFLNNELILKEGDVYTPNFNSESFGNQFMNFPQQFYPLGNNQQNQAEITQDYISQQHFHFQQNTLSKDQGYYPNNQNPSYIPSSRQIPLQNYNNNSIHPSHFNNLGTNLCNPPGSPQNRNSQMRRMQSFQAFTNKNNQTGQQNSFTLIPLATNTQINHAKEPQVNNQENIYPPNLNQQVNEEQQNYNQPFANLNTDIAFYIVEKGFIQIFTQSEKQSEEDYIKPIKELKQGDSFGEISFFANIPRIASARSIGASSLLSIKKKDFIKVLKEFPLDYETFCQMRDEVSNNNNYTSLKIVCYSCGSEGHTQFSCNKIHYKPNNEKIILQHKMSENREQSSRNNNLQRILVKYNSRKHKKNILEAQESIQQLLVPISNNISNTNIQHPSAFSHYKLKTKGQQDFSQKGLNFHAIKAFRSRSQIFEQVKEDETSNLYTMNPNLQLQSLNGYRSQALIFEGDGQAPIKARKANRSQTQKVFYRQNPKLSSDQDFRSSNYQEQAPIPEQESDSQCSLKIQMKQDEVIQSSINLEAKDLKKKKRSFSKLQFNEEESEKKNFSKESILLVSSEEDEQINKQARSNKFSSIKSSKINKNQSKQISKQELSQPTPDFNQQNSNKQFYKILQMKYGQGTLINLDAQENEELELSSIKMDYKKMNSAQRIEYEQSQKDQMNKPIQKYHPQKGETSYVFPSINSDRMKIFKQYFILNNYTKVIEEYQKVKPIIFNRRDKRYHIYNRTTIKKIFQGINYINSSHYVFRPPNNKKVGGTQQNISAGKIISKQDLLKKTQMNRRQSTYQMALPARLKNQSIFEKENSDDSS